MTHIDEEQYVDLVTLTFDLMASNLLYQLLVPWTTFPSMSGLLEELFGRTDRQTDRQTVSSNQ